MRGLRNTLEVRLKRKGVILDAMTFKVLSEEDRRLVKWYHTRNFCHSVMEMVEMLRLNIGQNLVVDIRQRQPQTGQ